MRVAVAWSKDIPLDFVGKGLPAQRTTAGCNITTFFMKLLDSGRVIMGNRNIEGREGDVLL